MHIDPFSSNQHSRSNTNNQSKRVPVTHTEGLVPLSLKMLNECIAKDNRQIDGIQLLKVKVVAQVIEEERINHKYVYIISDETGGARIIKSVSMNKDNDGPNPLDQLQMGPYYQFILSVREDKQELILYCQKATPITNFDEINEHLVRIMYSSLQRKNLGHK